MTPVLYNLLLVAAAPLAAAWFTFRQIRRGRLREGWRERMGYLPAPLLAAVRGREVIWVHAVSVGETNAAKPLLAELRRRRPQAVVVLSQVTETGRETAGSACADGLFYLPLDLVRAVDRTLRALRPKLLVTVDTELWPNLFWRARRAGVKVAVANGRISDRSSRRIHRLRAGWLYRWVLGNCNRLLMQSELDAERVRRLGAPRGTVTVTGNLKADEAQPEVTADRLSWWRETLGLAPGSPVLLAGSTGPGEEAILLAAWRRLREEFVHLRLVLVPRAIDRAGEIMRLCENAGADAVRRSELPARAEFSRARDAVVVVDTLGELAELFAVGDVAFVGRSLVPLGGSNVLQAAAQGRPVLSGPQIQNVRDSVRLLTEAEVCVIVRDAEELSAAAGVWLREPARAAKVGQRAREVVRRNRGATARTVEALLELLDD